MKFNNDYTHAIKVLLVMNKLKQKEVADLMGMSVGNFNKKLNRYENAIFDIEEAIRLTSILNCTLDKIFLIQEVA